MMELYHFGFSTCSQKVRLVLAEKGLDFVSHEVDLLGGAQHDPEYVKLNPNHVVPTLVHDGTALIESTLINEYLDDAFPAVPMRPSDPRGRHSLRLWTKLLDEKTGRSVGEVRGSMLERLNDQLTRRTRAVRTFPNVESCQRFVRAMAVDAVGTRRR